MSFILPVLLNFPSNAILSYATSPSISITILPAYHSPESNVTVPAFPLSLDVALNIASRPDIDRYAPFMPSYIPISRRPVSTITYPRLASVASRAPFLYLMIW